MLRVLIDNKDGSMWELPVTSADYKTTRYGKPSSFQFTMLRGGFYEDKNFKYNNGDVIRVELDETPVFYGYVFSIEYGHAEEVKITAYDQLRYLMSNEYYKFTNVTTSDVVKQIAKDFKLNLGKIVDTKYIIPTLLADGWKLMDTICNAMLFTTIATKKIYVLYDDFGKLALRDADDWVLDLAIGDVSLVYEYSLKRSIDSDTYNYIKFVQEIKSEKKGEKTEVVGRNAYVNRDSASIAKWGLLQLYQKVDDGYNVEQIKQVLEATMKEKNRESESFSIGAIGDIRVRAGCRLFIAIEEQGIGQYFQVEDCTHNFDGSDHTMKLELKVVR